MRERGTERGLGDIHSVKACSTRILRSKRGLGVGRGARRARAIRVGGEGVMGYVQEQEQEARAERGHDWGPGGPG